MIESGRLTPKQQAFCVHYTTIGADTFSNGTRAAVAAGYSGKSAYSQASRMLTNAKVRGRIQELHARNLSDNGITVEKVLADLEHERMIALGKDPPDVSAAIRASELEGRHLGMFADTVQVNVDRVREYSAAERVELDRLAQLLVTGHVSDAVPVPAPGLAEPRALPEALPDVGDAPPPCAAPSCRDTPRPPQPVPASNESV